MRNNRFKHNAAHRHRIGKMKFRVANWSEYEAGLLREHDAVDDRGSAVVVASTEALDTRWPAALLRSGDRNRSHARLGVRPATSPDGGFTDIGAEVDGIGSRRPRSHDAEPTSTDIAIGRQPARPWRSDKEARSRSYRQHRAGGLWRWPVWKKSMVPDHGAGGANCIWHWMPTAARSSLTS